MDIMSEIIKLNTTASIDSPEKRILLLNQLWEQIPEPKTKVKNSYLIVAKIVSISVKNGDLDTAWVWAQRGLVYSGNFNLAGESEFLMGEVAFARSDIETAKIYFKKAEQNSGKRLFKGKNPEYLNLIK